MRAALLMLALSASRDAGVTTLHYAMPDMDETCLDDLMGTITCTRQHPGVASQVKLIDAGSHSHDYFYARALMEPPPVTQYLNIFRSDGGILKISNDDVAYVPTDAADAAMPR